MFGKVFVILIVAGLVVWAWGAARYGDPTYSKDFQTWKRGRTKLVDSGSARTRHGDWIRFEVWRCRDGAYESEVKILPCGRVLSSAEASAAASEALASAGEEARREVVK